MLGSQSYNTSFIHRGVIQYALEGEAPQVNRFELAGGEQLGYGPTGGRGLLQPMSAEPVAQHDILQLWMKPNDGILERAITQISAKAAGYRK